MIASFEMRHQHGQHADTAVCSAGALYEDRLCVLRR